MITEEDIALVTDYAAMVREQAAAKGLMLKYDADPQAFVAFLSRQDSTHGVSSAHDPGRSYITPDHFAWMCAEHEGRPAACHAIRLIETDSLVEEIITHRLFENIEVKERWESVGLRPEARAEIERLGIRGRVAFGGGLWVHPGWRGMELSGLLRKVLRVISIPRLNWSWYFSTYQNTPNRREWAKGDGWNPHVIPLSSGFYPPYRGPLDVLLAGASLAQTLALLRESAI